MSVGRVHQLFGLEALRPATLTGGLALLLFWFDRTWPRRLEHVWVPTAKCLLALFVWMVLSTPGSLSEGTSFTLVFDNFIKTALMFLVMAAAVRDARDVERFALTYLVAGALYAFVVVTRFDVGGGGDWRLGHLYYYDANDFATLAVTAMPFGVYFVHAGRRPAVRLLAAAALGVLTLAFVYSGSRGGLLALTAVTIYIVRCYDRIPLRWRVSSTALVAVVLFGTASDQYWQQMGTIVSDVDYNRTGETGRLQIWSRGLGYMLDHPILGVGPDNFPVAEGTLSPLAERQQYGVGVRWSAAHNSFMQVGAELGFAGLAFYLGMLVTGFTALRAARRARDGDADTMRAPELAQAVTAALIGFVVGSFFLSLAYSEMLYTLLALAVGLYKLERLTVSRTAARGCENIPTRPVPVAGALM
jgi:probable O-glycosylation ligase (exosortase A-associated)